MAELTVLETKLAEVIGLAQAAQGAGQKISGLVDDSGLKGELDRMRAEAAETEERCTNLAENLDGKKTAILEKARETKQEASEMMSTYLGDDADGLDGFEFPEPARVTRPTASRRGRRSRRGRPRRARAPRPS